MSGESCEQKEEVSLTPKQVDEARGGFLRNHAYLPRPKSLGPAPSFTIPTLGEQTVPNKWVQGPYTNGIRTLMTPLYRYDKILQPEEFAEVAGPRRTLFFNPETFVAGIVTCGGLCPGLNNVIRHLVFTMHYTYHVHKVLGFKYGYEGVAGLHEPVELTTQIVSDIQDTLGQFNNQLNSEEDNYLEKNIENSSYIDESSDSYFKNDTLSENYNVITETDDNIVNYSSKTNLSEHIYEKSNESLDNYLEKINVLLKYMT